MVSPRVPLLFRFLHLAVHVGALLPLAWLFWAVPAGKLGGDPVQGLIHYLGIGGLRLLMLSLLVTPLARGLRKPLWNRLRRPLGLWAFAWVSLHFAAWISLDLIFAWSLIGREILERTYILIQCLADAAGAGRDLHPPAGAGPGAALETPPPAGVSGGDPGLHPFLVVGEKRLDGARHLPGAGAAFTGLAGAAAAAICHRCSTPPLNQ